MGIPGGLGQNRLKTSSNCQNFTLQVTPLVSCFAKSEDTPCTAVSYLFTYYPTDTRVPDKLPGRVHPVGYLGNELTDNSSPSTSASVLWATGRGCSGRGTFLLFISISFLRFMRFM